MSKLKEGDRVILPATSECKEERGKIIGVQRKDMYTVEIDEEFINDHCDDGLREVYVDDMIKEVNRSLDEIIKDIMNLGQYCEIKINGAADADEEQWDEAGGYNGYEASRMSNIESTDLGKELNAKLKELRGV